MEQPCSSTADYFRSYNTDTHTHQPHYQQPNYSSYYKFETFYDSVAYGNEPTFYQKPEYPLSWQVQPPYSYPYPQTDDDSLDQNNNFTNNFCDLTPYQALEHVSSAGAYTPPRQEAALYSVEGAFSLPSIQETSDTGLKIREVFPQADLCTQVVQGPSCYSVGEPYPSPLDQETSEASLGLPENISQNDLCPQGAHRAVSFSVEESFLSTIGEKRVEVFPEPMKSIFKMHQSDISVGIKRDVPDDVSIVKSPSHLPLKKRHRVIGRGTVDGKYSCPSCDRTFNRQGHLTQHRNAHHSGPLNQRCIVCGKRFLLREQLEKHELRHKEQNKSWECGHCPKRFNYKFDMIRHVKAVHSEAPHGCQVCGKRFVRLDHLRLHENKHRKSGEADRIPVLATKRKREDFES